MLVMWSPILDRRPVNEPTEVLDSVVEPLPAENAIVAEDTRRRFVRTFVLALVMFSIGVALTTVRLPYLVLEPGDTLETESFIEVEGLEFFPSPAGEIYFVTVTQRRLSPVGWVISSFSDSDEVFHEDELLRGRTIDEQREENAQLMLSSQSSAIAAALSELGFEVAEPNGVVVIDVVAGGVLDDRVARNDVITAVDGQPVLTFDEFYELVDEIEIGATTTLTVNRRGEGSQDFDVVLTDDTAAFLGVARDPDAASDGSGARIESVVEGGPVADLLEGGDRIIEVDDQPTPDFDSLVEVLRGLRSGDEVSVRATRGADAVSGSVTLGSRTTERIGISNANTQFRDAELPFEVDITTEEIGGPSAGLAFTLTILDVLTPGELTGGANVVVTGTIDRAGRIGAIGGVHQKAFAARDDGADVFIVPNDNLEEARAAVDDLRIEGVDTLDDALAIIAEFGGNALRLPAASEL